MWTVFWDHRAELHDHIPSRFLVLTTAGRFWRHSRGKNGGIEVDAIYVAVLQDVERALADG